jgi:MerR family transcriptional regulator, aldehyde-responsive regulator
MEAITIREAAEHAGLSSDTLRYYEREGLIPPVGRTPSGHRRYGAGDMAWIDYVCCLRTAGLGVTAIKEYVSLYQQGEVTLARRVELLDEHADAIRGKIADLTRTLTEIEGKVIRYRSALRRSEVGH